MSIAAQMWNLAVYLPLLIGDKIPTDDDHWECYLLLLDVLKFCAAKVTSKAHAGILSTLICEHHNNFIHCYPGVSLPPKMHYTIHFALQILR